MLCVVLCVGCRLLRCIAFAVLSCAVRAVLWCGVVLSGVVWCLVVLLCGVVLNDRPFLSLVGVSLGCCCL